MQCNNRSFRNGTSVYFTGACVSSSGSDVSCSIDINASHPSGAGWFSGAYTMRLEDANGTIATRTGRLSELPAQTNPVSRATRVIRNVRSRPIRLTMTFNLDNGPSFTWRTPYHNH